AIADSDTAPTATPHSFPTRRSSDLGGTVTDPQGDAVGAGPDIAAFSVCHTATELQLDVNLFTPWGNDKGVVIDLDVDQNSNTGRSEEHTSELQSLRHLVCRLLLEKK